MSDLIFNNSNELFNYVRQYDISLFTSLNSILSDYDINIVSVDFILDKLIHKDKFLLIDARSEKEFHETKIPGAINFPVLNSAERHNVGLVYKRYSQKAATMLAIEYASQKLSDLEQLILNSNKKDIIVYCWRGGGRSKYLSKMIYDIGFKTSVVEGGIKAYRAKVNQFFSQYSFPFDLIEITGMTCSGKTEILENLSEKYPSINLEKAAKHFSSLFGYIPYLINDLGKVHNQSAFENNIFEQILFCRNKKTFKNFFFIESESKKVGDFFIPKIIFEKMQFAPSILVECSMERRIQRVINDYFGSNNRGLNEMRNVLILKENFFKKELSKKLYLYLLELLENNKIEEFAGIMLEKYYDKKYKVKDKKPLLTINSDNISEAVFQIIDFFKKSN